MSDSALVIGTLFSPTSAMPEAGIVSNDVQEIVIEPVNEYMIASESTLAKLWNKPEEEEAWKDL